MKRQGKSISLAMSTVQLPKTGKVIADCAGCVLATLLGGLELIRKSCKEFLVIISQPILWLVIHAACHLCNVVQRFLV
jgi:hypothetical protein